MWKKVIILSLMLEQIDKNLISFILTKDSQHVSQTRKATLIQKKKKPKPKTKKQTNKQTNFKWLLRFSYLGICIHNITKKNF
jgi:SOS response regulatory protein OraA/RecX